MKNEKNIYIWLNKKPFAILGFIKHLVEKHKANVFVFYKTESDTDRSGINCTHTIPNLFKVIDNSVEKTLKFYGLNPNNSIYVINGLFSYSLDQIISNNFGNIKIVCMTEPPCCLSKFQHIEKALKRIKYLLLKNKYKKYIDCFICFGEKVKKYFTSIGWKTNFYEFLYIPLIEDVEHVPDKDFECNNFLYIGRNRLFAKGLDLPLQYFRKNKNLNLYIIGDYGEDREEVIKIASKLDNIHLLGSFNQQKTFEYCCNSKISCILVPSRVDGCNLNTYLSIYSGTPCLASNRCGSSNLIEESKSGFIFKPTKKGFKNAINKFEKLSNFQKQEMSCNAINYKKEIHGEYMAENLYSYLQSLMRNEDD